MKKLGKQWILLLVPLMLNQCVSLSMKADRQDFRKADRDRDGRLSWEEARDYEYRRVFDLIDLAGDGMITEEEAREISPDYTKSQFRAFDLNRDDAVTFPEFEKVQDARGDVKKRFLAADLDGDGFVTRKEADTRVRFLQDYARGGL